MQQSQNSFEDVALCCTSINPLSDNLIENAEKWKNLGGRYFITLDRRAGDRRHASIDYIEPDRSPLSQYEQLCPHNSYSRKNIAFVEAARSGVQYIFETDDDNVITDYSLIASNLSAFAQLGTPHRPPKELNLYKSIYSTTDNIWARGFPLQWIETPPEFEREEASSFTGVVQFLINGNPDVDAIFRLVKSNDLNIPINADSLPITLFKQYHPFNSQATLWPRQFFSLCYLPSTCSFRMTDIWRGYIAQRILYQLGYSVKFERPSCNQIRNSHLLHKDFFDEYDGYKQSELVINTLKLSMLPRAEMAEMLLTAYDKLIAIGIFAELERTLLTAFLEDIEA
jgi:hypothetical protein